VQRKETSASKDLLAVKCKEHKLKMTPQRIVIYEQLRKSKDHPSADIICRKARKIFPSISFDTVNRTLATFSEIGIINVVEGRGDPRRFDPNIERHHHFRCMKCNTIVDFKNRSYDHIQVPRNLRKRFTVLNKRVVLEGMCNKCSSR
jgi:Fur family peroxide stress response transcriptional regulator